MVPDVYIAMGQTAENVALLTGISREDQDHWGVRSQNRAEEAINSGFFEREIVPVKLPDGSTVGKDDGPRAGTTYEKISQLKPVFRPNGTITAGNACPLNDGAAAVVVVSDAKAKELGLKPLARIVATGVSGLSPEIMGLGPIEATEGVGQGRQADLDIDLVEINEAFAVQVLGSARELGIDEDKLNVSGGAIALGHPFGMTGARITATLLNNLTTYDKTFGLETMCVGGGQGMAMVVERSLASLSMRRVCGGIANPIFGWKRMEACAQLAFVGDRRPSCRALLAMNGLSFLALSPDESTARRR